MTSKIIAVLAATSLGMMLAGCGGGDGSGTTTTTTTAVTPGTPVTTNPITPVMATTISGSAVKGPVTGATVTVKNASTGAALGTTTTGAGGSYSVSVPYVGDVIVEVAGGTYTDEATNLATALTTPLKAVIKANGANVTGILTPLTTMAFTHAFGNSAAVAITSAAFDLTAAALATQFKLPGLNLVTTLPTVTGSLNDYGKVLAGLSKYLQLNNVTLPTITAKAFNAAEWATFSSTYSSAYKAANLGSNINFSFDGNVLNLGGTGVGGGTGTCGINVQGTLAVAGIIAPINFDYCATGVLGGSCDSGNSTLARGLAGQSGLAGAVNLRYTYSAACAPGAFTVNYR